MVAEYWTPERMARAVPVETSEPVAGAEQELQEFQPKMVGPERTAEASPPVVPVAERPVNVTKWSHTNGKAFFRGERPHGTFQARTFRTMSDWIDHGKTFRGLDSDVAFVSTFANESGRRVVDAVGGHGLSTGGAEYEFYADWFAYPVNRSGGEVIWACWDNTTKAWHWFYNFIRIGGCDFGGGSSGGPYLKDYDNNSGLGQIKTVDSWSPEDDHSHSHGPFLRAAVWDMYVAADGD